MKFIDADSSTLWFFKFQANQKWQSLLCCWQLSLTFELYGTPTFKVNQESVKVIEQVIVIEKGTYTPAEKLTTLEKDAYEDLYERGGLFMTTEGGGMMLAYSLIC